jgi:hypothetical protein
VVPPSSDRIARVPPYSWTTVAVSRTGLSPAAARRSRRFRYQQPLPLACSAFARHYWRNLTGVARATPLLMSFPPATEMFQFAGFASRPYEFSAGYPPGSPPTGGLPHSEIPGSPIARISPGLFAACRVLPRLSVPRHPPDALVLRFRAIPPRTTASPGRTDPWDRPRKRQALGRA